MSSTNAYFSDLIAALPEARHLHAPTGKLYALLKTLTLAEVAAAFSAAEAKPQPFGPFGELVFPYIEMGAINSLDLFGIDELILFSFYHANRNRYRKVLDLGANIGLHSFVLSRCGFDVRSFEPDPTHFALLNRTLANNGCASVTPVNAAVSFEAGEMEFIRVLGNTTGSHLAGAKAHVYGERETFPVRVEAFGELIKGVDFFKMDVEGHEAAILTRTTAAQWQGLEAVVEIGNAANAEAVFGHFQAIGVNLFAQKINWDRVTRLEDMPTSYHDGSLFISAAPTMAWG